MSALLSLVSPTFQRLTKVECICNFRCIYGNKYTLRYPNRHLVLTLGVAGGIHEIQKSHHNVLHIFRTFASRVKSRTSFYDTLGVTPKASQAQIKSAYYKLSKAFHPDRNQDNPTAASSFSDINEAYSVLSNAKLRKRYDNGIYSSRDLTHGVRDEPLIRKREKKIRNTRSEVYNDQGERMYDFDEYFRAHYGEALDREQRERKSRKKRQKEFDKINEVYRTSMTFLVSAAVISVVVGLLFIK
ncbi:dnaJ homolog subfamily C member 30, mitochondrial-like [Antedon mediterranea]|uniref:dnaJ homolog subfamily C member 30, mitochondrial-like n=1 Tax=Antedon mediterranea TaxID=105859 RepID=UPI003AF4DDC3